ncbi:hypothetical protein [Roseisolibacter agri]|uniref:DUF305 domain-containing protein n=1 Tax=Roseisolibacter agri TaxID=2014610 RepID=A0AA37QDI9_9BACT|nr:hypothetical protein [Roseisolibacter agri]GLC26916.1 hypothetical protein rosag_34290 [Roseisolibacter agri]
MRSLTPHVLVALLALAPSAAHAQRAPILTEASVTAFLRAFEPTAAEHVRLRGLVRAVTRDVAVQRSDSVRACRGDERSVIQPGTAAGVPIDSFERLMQAAVNGDQAAKRRVDAITAQMQAASRTVTARGNDCERQAPPQEWFVRRRAAANAELRRLGWSGASRATMRTTGRTVEFGARLDSIALAHADGALSPAALRALHDALHAAVIGDDGAARLAPPERATVARHRAALRATFAAFDP